MSFGQPVLGLPGIHTSITSTSRKVRWGVGNYPSQLIGLLPGAAVIDGTKSQDSGNTGYLTTIRAGMPFGKATSGGKYANSILGAVASAHTAGGVSLTLSAAAAAELVRRVGASGTFKVASPTVASQGATATFHVQTVTYSAVNVTTGVVTITAITYDVIAGGLVLAADGTEYALGVTDDGFGIPVADAAGNRVDVNFSPQSNLLIAGALDVSGLCFYPTDTGMAYWYKRWLNGLVVGQPTADLYVKPSSFLFSDDY